MTRCAHKRARKSFITKAKIMENIEYEGISPLKHTYENDMHNGKSITRHSIYADSDQYLWVASGYGDLNEGSPSTDQAMSTFQLFAAAPDLLGALMEAVKYRDRMKNAAELMSLNDLTGIAYKHPEWYAEAKAAIAK